jgi:aspartyl-tRNA(Asn)/glutamyl-tRNA(Gln) amidotransferase subunit A
VSEWLSVAETAAQIARGETTAVRIVDRMLVRIRDVDRQIGAYLAVDGEGAREAANAIDKARTAGQRLGPLAGVPIALKDVLVTRGLETTAASKILEGWVPPYDGTVVEKLRPAGAINHAKDNCDDFAMGSTTDRTA